MSGNAAAEVTAADRALLGDLVARYAACVDERRYARAAALFTEDAVLVLPEPPGRLAPVTAHHGRAAIEAALHATASFPLTRHTVEGQLLDVAGESADAPTVAGRVLCCAHHLRRRTSGALTDLVWHVRYADTYRRESAAWRIARREVHLDWIETRTPRLWRIDAEEASDEAPQPGLADASNTPTAGTS